MKRWLAILLVSLLVVESAQAAPFTWTQVAAPASITASSEVRVYAASKSGTADWILFRQTSVSAGTGKLFRRTSGGVTQISAGPSGWTHYLSVNYDATLDQIVTTTERQFATSSPNGAPSWTTVDIGGSNAKWFSDKAIRRLAASAFMVPIGPRQTSSDSIGLMAFISGSGTSIQGYNPTAQSWLTQQVAGARVSDSCAIVMGAYTSGDYPGFGINGAEARSFTIDVTPGIASTSLILPGLAATGAARGIFTFSNGTSTDVVSVSCAGANAVSTFASLLVRTGASINLMGSERVYLPRSDGRVYESNAGATSFSLVDTATIPQLSVVGQTVLAFYTNYSGRLGAIVSDGSIYELTPSPPVVTISATPALVPLGTATTVTWSATDATSCTASGAWSGSKNATSGSEAVVVSAVNTNTFTLSCTGLGGSGNNSTAVTGVAVSSLSTTPPYGSAIQQGTYR